MFRSVRISRSEHRSPPPQETSVSHPNFGFLTAEAFPLLLSFPSAEFLKKCGKVEHLALCRRTNVWRRRRRPLSHDARLVHRFPTTAFLLKRTLLARWRRLSLASKFGRTLLPPSIFLRGILPPPPLQSTFLSPPSPRLGKKKF